MLGVLAIVLVVLAAIVLTGWITFTITRLDRLHARVDAAQAALDAQLVRRAAALLHAAESRDSRLPDNLRPGYETLAQTALSSDAEHRESAENAVGRAVTEISELPHPLRPDAVAELHEAAERVRIARRFYNDAVRDTRALRARRMPRVLRMAGRRELPQFFDIADTVPARRVPPAPDLPSPPPPRTTEEDQT